MIYGAEAFLLAYATWGLEQWRPSPANRRAPGDPGPLRSPCCCGALRRTDCGFDCQGCGASLAIRDGVPIVRATPTGDNKIAADFYHSQLWPTVRFWERAFWILNGGERPARDVVLRHLPKSPGLRLLDVAIGDGVYTSWLRQDWSIVGVDVSTTQLAACRRRNCGRNRRVLSHSRYEIIWRGGGYLMVGNAP